MPRYRALRRWAKALSKPRFRWLAAVSLVWTLTVMLTVLKMLRQLEDRPGAQLIDPVLAHLPSADLSLPIFIIEYGCMVAVLYTLASRPVRMSVALLGYGIAMFLRLVAILIAPLEPPPDLILLVDPLVSAFDGGPELKKDLFFSGHTTAMMLFTVAAPYRKMRAVLGVLTLAIGVMLMVQRVHYAIDIFVAPAMAYSGWQLARLIAPSLLRLKWKRRLPRRV